MIGFFASGVKSPSFVPTANRSSGKSVRDKTRTSPRIPWVLTIFPTLNHCTSKHPFVFSEKKGRNQGSFLLLNPQYRGKFSSYDNHLLLSTQLNGQLSLHAPVSRSLSLYPQDARKACRRFGLRFRRFRHELVPDNQLTVSQWSQSAAS